MIGSFIFIFIGMWALLGESIYGYRNWEILPSKWDRLRLQNHAPYLVEGKGGLSVLLGHDEAALLRRWGSANHRDFASPEKLYYHTSRFKGNFILYNGRIVEIQYLVDKNTTESLRWFTALGLYADDFNALDEKSAKEKILAVYSDTSLYVDLPGRLELFTRGIRFHFKDDKIFQVDIFYPRREY